MEKDKREVAIRISGVRKAYRLGQITAKTLQGDIKERIERSRERMRQRKEAGSAGKTAEDVKTAGADRFYALDGIDLTIYKGEALGIIGKNGAGKSTLLKLLSRITAPTEGEIEIHGRVTSMLEVGTGFHSEMTGRENIYLNGAILGMSRAETEAKMDDIISFSEVRDFIDTPVKRYSSGMYVKLGFSVAAHLDSEIMIMDEVLAVGDMDFQHKCLDKMRAVAEQKGRTVLYVSHNMNTIKRLCTRCIVLDKGKIIFDGDVDKAISIYMGENVMLQKRYEYSAEDRPYDKWIRLNRRLNLDALEIRGTERPSYLSTERPEATLWLTANQPFKNVAFRLELWYEDGVKIGSMLAGSFVDLKEGKNVVKLRLDLEHLTAGLYRADLIAFQYDADGNEDVLDGVYPGIVWEVRDAGETQYVNWSHQYWGHVRLHDLEVAAGEENDSLSESK